MNTRPETDIRDSGPPDNEEFGVYTDIAYLPVSECPAYLRASVGGICTAGTATIQVFNTRFRIAPGMVVTLLPWQLASIKDISEDFRMMFFRISLDMFTDTLSTLWRLTPGFFFYMRKHVVSEADGDHTRRFSIFCEFLEYRQKNAPENCRRESIMQLLRVYYWDIYTIYINDPLAGKNIRYTRKEELAFRFMRLIVEERNPNMEVAYYAEKLGVTSKYLTNLIRSISGQSARDWIVYYTIIEIKSLLRESSMDLKAIVSRINFLDQSSLSRFFKNYTGMTPSQYRRSIHF